MHTHIVTHTYRSVDSLPAPGSCIQLISYKLFVSSREIYFYVIPPFAAKTLTAIVTGFALVVVHVLDPCG